MLAVDSVIKCIHQKEKIFNLLQIFFKHSVYLMSAVLPCGKEDSSQRLKICFEGNYHTHVWTKITIVTCSSVPRLRSVCRVIQLDYCESRLASMTYVVTLLWPVMAVRHRCSNTSSKVSKFGAEFSWFLSCEPLLQSMLWCAISHVSDDVRSNNYFGRVSKFHNHTSLNVPFG